MGNLRSVQKALQFVGQDAVITSDLDEINKADKIVLPGVGAIGDAMETIRKKGFDKAIYKACDEGKPFLGICLVCKWFLIKAMNMANIRDWA